MRDSLTFNAGNVKSIPLSGTQNYSSINKSLDNIADKVYKLSNLFAKPLHSVLSGDGQPRTLRNQGSRFFLFYPMAKYNRSKFFDQYRLFLERHEFNLSQSRVDALNFLLNMFEQMPVWSDERHCAYALATIHVETAYTYLPIQEYGSFAYFERRYGSQTAKGRELGNDAPGEGAKYSGKGFVQLTGETNYEKLELKIRQKFPQLVEGWETKNQKSFDLTDFAEQAKDQTFAFLIMTVGMFEGLFTGKKFSDYINLQITDYRNARRIINGLDRAAEIGGYAREIEKILINAKVSAVPQNPASAVLLSANPLSAQTAQNSESEQPINIGGVAPGENETGNTVETQLPQISPEPTETTTVEQTGANTAQITTEKNEQDVNQPAEVPAPEPQGVFAKLTGGMTALFSGTAVYTVFEKFGGVSMSQTVLILVVLVVVLAFIGFLFWAWLDAYKSNKKIELEVLSKTDINRKDVVWK